MQSRTSTCPSTPSWIHMSSMDITACLPAYLGTHLWVYFENGARVQTHVARRQVTICSARSSITSAPQPLIKASAILSAQCHTSTSYPPGQAHNRSSQTPPAWPTWWQQHPVARHGVRDAHGRVRARHPPSPPAQLLPAHRRAAARALGIARCAVARCWVAAGPVGVSLKQHEQQFQERWSCLFIASLLPGPPLPGMSLLDNPPGCTSTRTAAAACGKVEGSRGKRVERR
jgi:hypothetical protein